MEDKTVAWLLEACNIAARRLLCVEAQSPALGRKENDSMHKRRLETNILNG